MNYFISIAGNMGAGKTEFTKALSKRLGWELNLEPVEQNPYLADFYQDMKRWAFQSQAFYLSKRMQDHFELVKRNFSVVQDRSFYENYEIFARNLHDNKILPTRDWQTLGEIYNTMLQISTPPDLLIYLQASTSTIAARVLERGREAEKPITLDYLEKLNTLYQSWIKDFSFCPTLTVPIDGTNLRDNETEQNQVISKIWDILNSKQEPAHKHFMNFDLQGQENLQLT